MVYLFYLQLTAEEEVVFEELQDRLGYEEILLFRALARALVEKDKKLSAAAPLAVPTPQQPLEVAASTRYVYV